ncbi:hypothetical protein [Sessilibacter corallicola]|uniref:hypothetical protein n=1 Tax=Sessilibacter corallicola TaxID=2904075 RepID=UPI001E47673A|nr:hypothetical protein [Sessilibacter corallicola]MCE2029073.1 hypothetical protein [Sessilibacter corallicola]
MALTDKTKTSHKNLERATSREQKKIKSRKTEALTKELAEKTRLNKKLINQKAPTFWSLLDF